MAVILFEGCKCNQSDDDRVGVEFTSPLGYAEDDTLQITLPESYALHDWLNYHQQFDTAFRIINFPASGINIRIDSFEACPTMKMEEIRNWQSLISWSPDSSMAIDIWSYNYEIDHKKDSIPSLQGGSPDQLVKLIDSKTGACRQLLFNGPSQIVQTADWLSNDAFLLSMINIDAKENTQKPDIILIHLKDSLFTNFRYIGRLSTNLEDREIRFSQYWLTKKGYQME